VGICQANCFKTHNKLTLYPLGKCPFAPSVWLWAAKSVHIFLEWRTTGVMDPVLCQLFAMGLFDWMGEDNRLNQITPAMCHATMMGVSLFCRIVENDIKVCLFAFCNLCKKANIVLAQYFLGGGVGGGGIYL